MQDLNSIILNISIQLPGFLAAIVIHEAAHAFVAYRFGDQTAKSLGRMTLNPSAHIDPIGTLLFPLIGIIFGTVMFGWAKPVPIDPRSFKNIRKATFWVSFAGPLSNIISAIVLAFLLGLFAMKVDPNFFLYQQIRDILHYAILINVVLAVFNLIPFPPLDGSKMVQSFLSYEKAMSYESLSRYTFIFFLILIFTNAFRFIIFPFLQMAEAMIRYFCIIWM